MNNTYFETIHKIITMGHWVTDQVSLELKEFGITEPQYNVLLILKTANGKPLTVQEILEGMVQRSSNVTRIIDKLLAKGYVNRCECCTNRRKMDITITEEGIKLLRKLNKKVNTIHKPMMENLGEQELKLLNQLISKLRSNKS
ncbi:MarR family winged helix-turn-helix transcriptional regulator [Flexithrix dorotheae]|uniref:MarR family winged helix-turn-helix transcriptional regulator n=1 Tax=Flexithrix dorotheae TaxID=70993 RepID=UPI000364953D|nr:MarR family transcriptional regulator [Flexithrix dorotheae]